MAKKLKSNVETVPAGYAPWAIINKETGLAIGIFNPQGKPAALRRVAIRAAQSQGLSFTKVKLIPASLLSMETRISSKLDEAPTLVDPNAQ